MKTFRKIISVLLCVTLLFTTVAFSVTAKGSEEAKEETGIVLTIKEICSKISAFFESVIERIKRVLGIGYDKVDIRSFSENAFPVPGIGEDFVPQGICYVEELGVYAVSGYVKGENSRIYLYDDKTDTVRKLVLNDFDKHAGGIASYKKDLWVSAGGSENEGGYVYHLSTDVLKKAKDGDTVSFDGKFQVPTRASTLFANDGMLFVGEFYEYNDYPSDSAHHYKDNKAWACGYKLPLDANYNGDLLVPDMLLSVPDKVQGISITESGKVVFSTSYGRKNDSVLYVYKPYEEWETTTATVEGTDIPLYVATEKSLLLKTKMPTLSEGIDFHNGKLYILFESGAKIYSDAKEVIEYVWETDVEALINQ